MAHAVLPYFPTNHSAVELYKSRLARSRLRVAAMKMDDHAASNFRAPS